MKRCAAHAKARKQRGTDYAKSHLLLTEGREGIEPYPWPPPFCQAAIAKDEVVVVKGGYVLNRAQRDRIGEELGPSEIQITEGLFIGPTTPEEREGGMMHLNHSCEPNLGLQGQIVFVGMRDIAAGEELTFDYAMTDDERYEMHCYCGSEVCRKLVTGADWRKPELQKKYSRYFSWFIQRKIDSTAFGQKE